MARWSDATWIEKWLHDHGAKPTLDGYEINRNLIYRCSSACDLPEGAVGLIHTADGRAFLTRREAKGAIRLDVTGPKVPLWTLRSLSFIASAQPFQWQETLDHIFKKRTLFRASRDYIEAAVNQYLDRTSAGPFNQVFRAEGSHVSVDQYFGYSACARLILVRLLQQKGLIPWEITENIASEQVDCQGFLKKEAPLMQAIHLVVGLPVECSTEEGLCCAGKLPNLYEAFQPHLDFVQLYNSIPSFSRVPVELIHLMIGPGGFCDEFPLFASDCDVENYTLAVGFDQLIYLHDALRDHAPSDAGEDLSHRASWELTVFLNCDPYSTPAEKWLPTLRKFVLAYEVHGLDNFAMVCLSEIMGLEMLAAHQLGQTWDPDRTLRRILRHNFVLICPSIIDLYILRLRLGLTAFQWYPDGVLPHLPELNLAVRHGFRSVRDDQTIPSYKQESETLEFKRGFDWNPRTRQQDPELRHGIIRSVAAMLNSKGGTIALCVTDAGIPVGMDEEIETIRDRNPLDVLEQRLRTHLRMALQPPPLESIKVTFPRMANRIFMLIEVTPTSSITYCKFRDKHGNPKEEIFVRDGNRTITLHGRERDRFVLERAKRSAFID